ncbi:hypothetical protein DMENIID0001_048780 [Sergentomyia squamirostris]
MEITIPPDLIEKLKHNIHEIRVRALKNIDAKIHRATSSKYKLNYNGVNLMKALVTWFSHETLYEEKLALNIMFFVLTSEHSAEIIRFLTKDYLEGELGKIQQVLRDEEQLALIEELRCVIQLSERNECPTVTPQNIEIIDLSDDDLTSLVDNLHLDEIQLTPREYVKCWSNPNAADLNSLRLIKESLNSEDEKSLEHALDFLMTAMEDYPAEYFLQPPYLVLQLQQLQCEGRDVKQLLWKFNEILQKRIHIVASAALYVSPDAETSADISNQMSVSKYCQESFKVCSSLLKSTEDQDVINWCFRIFRQLVDLLQIDEQRLFSTVEYFLKELGLLARFYRKCVGYKIVDFTGRKLYIKVLQLLIKLKSIGGDVQEQESDQELNIARLDVAIKRCYPEIYKSLEAVCPKGKKNVEILLNCEEILRPAVDLLRPLKDLKDEEVILAGLAALKSSNIHKSTQLTEMLIKAVNSCLPLLPGNSTLRESAEKIILHLLAHPSVDIQKFSYQLCAEKMKYFVSSLTNGEQLMSRRGFQNENTFRNLGIPLNEEILMEIVAFGCASKDPVIHSSAESMVLFILKSRVVLRDQWKVLKELLIPIMPLLQVWSEKSSKLSESILSLLHPDGDYTNVLEVIGGTVRFLFSPDPSVREEAISRIFYILSAVPNANEFTPIDSIGSNAVSNYLCILDYQSDTGARFKESTQPDASLDNLMAILKSDDVEPAVRKTALMQINVLAMDPGVNEKIMEMDDYYFVILDILDKVFKVSQTRDFLDACIPAVGILCKLLLHCPALRLDLAGEVHVYIILLRTLLLFAHNTMLQFDATVALFLLAYSKYTVGRYSISLPRVLNRMKIPIVTQFHWSQSPHKTQSDLEEMFPDDCPENGDTTSECSTFWQFLRISFADIWFNGLDNVLTNARNSKRDSEDIQRINYAHILTGGQIKLIQVLDFDDRLRMTKKDLLLIHASLPMDSFRYFIHQIENSTTHGEVSSAIAHIQCNLTLDSSRKFPMESLISVLKKFCLSPPATADDENVFRRVLELLQIMLEHDADGKTKEWLSDQVKIKHSVFVSIFTAPQIPVQLLEENARLLRKIFKHHGETTKEKNFLGEIFRTIVKIMNEHKGNLSRGRILMSLLTTLVYSTSLEIDNPNQIILEIFRYSASTKSLCQAGSKFIVSCLLTIRGLLELTSVDGWKIKRQYVRYLSGLCGHTDVWVRQASWMILCKSAEDFSGAHMLIDELKYLPGGFHACCIETLLDNKEAGRIREIAGNTFRNLISHRTTLSGHFGSVPVQVSPRCSESEMEDLSPESLIILIVRKHHVADGIRRALEHFSIWDAVQNSEESPGKILTNTNTVHGFCIVLKGIVEIDHSYIDVLVQENCLQSLMSILAQIPTNHSDSVLQMASGICSLLMICLQRNEDILQTIVGNNHAAVAALLFLMQPKIYQNRDNGDELAEIFVKILSLFGTTAIGYNIIMNLMQQNIAERVFRLIGVGLKKNATTNFQIACMEFISVYLRMGIQQESQTFLHLLDPSLVIDSQNSENSENIDPNIPLRSNEKVETCNDNLSTIIFSRILNLLNTLCAQDKPEMASFHSSDVKKMAAKTVGLLLQSSPTARNLARNAEFFTVLVKRLKNTNSSIGTTFADFVRRYGEVKKKPIVEDLIMITDILCGWYSAVILDDESEIDALCRILLSLWTWSGSSCRLQINFWLLLKLLSEKSLPFCRSVSMTLSGFPHSILHLMLTATVQETNKAKQQDLDISRLSLLLRFLTNCCCCIEGRLQMNKLRILDNISQFHPAIRRQQRPLNHVIEEWLAFWEIFSRYPEGASVKHMTVLTALIEQKSHSIRRKCIAILRNFAIQENNGAALLASADFLKIIKATLDDGADRNEQLMISIAVWSIVANNYRAKNAIKSTSIPGKIQRIQRMLVLEGNTSEDNQLFMVLDTLTNILNQ